MADLGQSDPTELGTSGDVPRETPDHLAVCPGPLLVWKLDNGYWKARIELPWPNGGKPYVQTADSFHDKQEARDWGEFMLSLLTSEEPY